MGATKRMDNPTRINAMSQERIQIKRKFDSNPKLIDTSASVTKKVVMALMIAANFISINLGICFYE